MNFTNIPAELKMLRQWVCWRYEHIDSSKPTKLPLRARDGCKASVSNPLDWDSFDNAAYAFQWCSGIGFVFTKTDPYTGIDLDEADSTAAQTWANEIYTQLASYSELSPSGKGLHIIVKGVLPGPGVRRKNVEMYDNLRFFTFTGNRVNNFEIEPRQTAVDYLYSQLAVPSQVVPTYQDAPERRTDYEVWQMAAQASNGEKFRRLYAGDWQTDYGRLSQSEADFALLNIISFYSQNRAQIIRIFRQSGLGQRQKAKRDDYLQKMITRSFDRQPPQGDLDDLRNQWVALAASAGIAV